MDNKLIDLHTHTNYSDGELSPIELINLAKERGIRVISITDHNTLRGNQELFDNYPNIKDIEIIPGIELTAKVDKGRMHILGYGMDLSNLELNKKMIELRDNSINSVLSIMEQIKKDYGIIFTYSEIKELVKANHNLGRPDIAKLCIRKGYAKTVQEAFDRYLIDAYSKIIKYNKFLSKEECLDLITKSGGIPVLAHPYSLQLNDIDLFDLISYMKNNGLQGIEVYHSNNSLEERNTYLQIANKLDLLVSGGSDYHGPLVKPNIDLGMGINNNIKIRKLSLVDRLHNI